MKQSLITLIILIFALAGLSSAAVVTPVAQLTVGGEAVELDLNWRLVGGKIWTLAYTDLSEESVLRSLTVTGDTDPFLNYAVGFVNPFAMATSITLDLIIPYVGGPYNTVMLSHTSDATDGNQSGSAVVGLDTEANVANALLDNTVVTGLGTGCTIVPPPIAQDCFEGADSSVAVASAATGTFGVRLNFTLSAGDSYTATGLVTLDNANTFIPEPSTYLFIGSGLIFFAALYRRGSRNNR